MSEAAVAALASRSRRDSIAARMGRGLGYSLLAQISLYAMNFLLAPVYARAMAPDDYGTVSLASSIRSLLLLLMPMSTAGAVTYWLNLHRRSESSIRHSMGAIYGLNLAFSVAWLAIILATGASLQGLVIPDMALPFWPYGAMVVGSAWLLSLQTIPMAILAATERMNWTAAINVGLGVVQSIFVILLVVMWRRAAAGQIESMFYYALVAAPLFFYLMLREAAPLVDWPLWKEVTAYCLPLIPHQLSAWGLNVSDRVIIAHYGHVYAHDLGLYSFGYSIAMILQAALSAVSGIWSPVYMEQARSNPNAQKDLGRTAAICCLGMSLAASGLILFAPLLVGIIGGAKYAASARFVAPVVFGYFMQSLYLFPTMSLFHMKQTRRLPLITVASVALNIGLNLWLIPRFGVIAAAWTTAAGFSLQAILGFVVGHPVFPLRYPLKPLIAAGAVIAMSFVLSHYSSPTLIGVVLNMLCWLTAAVLSWFGCVQELWKARGRTIA